MTDRYHLACIFPLDPNTAVVPLPSDLQITLTKTDHSYCHKVYSKLLARHGTTKIGFLLPPTPQGMWTGAGADSSNTIYIRQDFRRKVNALLQRKQMIVLDRETKTIKIDTVKSNESPCKDLFAQALEAKSPGILKRVSEGGRRGGSRSRDQQQQQQQYNSRSTCCFGNVVLMKSAAAADGGGGGGVGDQDALQFGILGHPGCTVDDDKLKLIYNKIQRWYCLQ